MLPTLSSLFGCQILAPFYLAALMMGYDQRVPPTFEFPEDAKRIVVVTYAEIDTQTEYGHVDQELNDMLSRMLFKGLDEPTNQFVDKKRDIRVIKASKVAKWQDEHHDWTSMDPAEIGKALKADYVIYIEVGKMSFYEDGPSQILYHGQADVTLSVVRVENEEVALPRETISIHYPNGRPIPVSPDIPPAKFRRDFIRRVAERLSWYFLPHEHGEEFEKTPL